MIRRPAMRLGDRVVLGLLLLDVGRGAPVEEQELGAHQAGAVGPGRERGAGVGHRAEVGGDGERRAVAGHGRLLGEGELPGAPLGQLGGAPLGTPPAAPATGSTCSSPVPPSSDDVVPSGTVSTSRPAATTTGMSRARARIAACEVGLPCGEDDAGHQVEVQAGRLGGRQVAGDQDALGRHLPGGLAGQRPQHLVADRADVGGALPQVGVGQVRPLALDLGQAAGPGGDGPGAGADARP